MAFPSLEIISVMVGIWNGSASVTKFNFLLVNDNPNGTILFNYGNRWDDQHDCEGSIMPRVSSSSKDCWKPFSTWAGIV